MPWNKSSWLWCLFCCLLCTKVFAQEITLRVERLNQAGEESKYSAFSIAEDAKGFLWFGVENGLEQYDGYGFVGHQPFAEAGVPANPADERVTDMALDPEGRLWCATPEGVRVFDPLSNKRLLQKKLLPLEHTIIDKIIPTSAGVFIFSWDGRCFHFQNEIQSISLPGEGKISNIFEINNKIWALGNDAGFYTFQNGQFSAGRQTRCPDLLVVPSLLAQMPDTEGFIWAVYDNGLYRLSPEAGKCEKQFSLNDLHPKVLHVDPFGMIWIIDDRNKIYNFSSFDKKLQPVKTEGEIVMGHAPEIFQKGDLMWLLSDKGIYKIQRFGYDFREYEMGGAAPVQVLAQSENNVLFIKNNDIYFYENSSGNLQAHPKQSLTSLIPLAEISSATADEKGNWYFIGESFDVVFCNNNLDNCKTLLSKNKIANILNVLPDGSRVWLGTKAGLFILKDGVVELFEYPAQEHDLSGADIQVLKKARAGGLWVGTKRQGLYYINQEGKIDKHFYTNYTKINDVKSRTRVFIGSIKALCETTSGIYLLTGKDIKRLLPETSRFQVLPILREEGLEKIEGIQAQEGFLWLTSPQAMFRVDTIDFIEKKYVFNLNIEDSLSTYKTILSSDGQLFITTSTNTRSFFPGKQPGAGLPPSINITRFKKSGEDQTEAATQIRMGKAVHIYPGDKDFSFEFALSDYGIPEANQFYYKLEQSDMSEEWKAAGTSRQVTYNARVLSAGQYTFSVKSIASNQRAAREVLEVPIIIHEVFYKQLWFFFLVFALVSLIAYALYRYNLNQAIAYERLRTKIASDLHDELGSSLTRINMYAQLLKSGVFSKKPEKATEALDNIASDSREVVSMMSDVVWSIDARKEKMSDLLDRMREHVDQMLSPRNIHYEFLADDFPAEKKVDLNIRQNVLLIYKESINNIAKHSDADKVEVQLKNEKGIFIMRVKDNGVKPSTNKNGTRLGLKNMEMRAKKIDATLSIQNGQGYEVTLKRKAFC